MAGDLPQPQAGGSTVITVPLLVVSGRVVAEWTERGNELFELEVNEKVDALAAELPQWREEGR
jgi:hypothetical protein